MILKVFLRFNVERFVNCIKCLINRNKINLVLLKYL